MYGPEGDRNHQSECHMKVTAGSQSGLCGRELQLSRLQGPAEQGGVCICRMDVPVLLMPVFISQGRGDRGVVSCTLKCFINVKQM